MQKRGRHKARRNWNNLTLAQLVLKLPPVSSGQHRPRVPLRGQVPLSMRCPHAGAGKGRDILYPGGQKRRVLFTSHANRNSRQARPLII